MHASTTIAAVAARNAREGRGGASFDCMTGKNGWNAGARRNDRRMDPPCFGGSRQHCPARIFIVRARPAVASMNGAPRRSLTVARVTVCKVFAPIYAIGIRRKNVALTHESRNPPFFAFPVPFIDAPRTIVRSADSCRAQCYCFTYGFYPKSLILFTNCSCCICDFKSLFRHWKSIDRPLKDRV